jgi:hypothetical protein
VSVIPVENDPDRELNLDISQIQKCELHGSENSDRLVGLILNDRKVLLAPINPFDPKLIALANDGEASAMIKVIEAFHSGVDPAVDINPYLRQRVATKPKQRRFRSLIRKMGATCRRIRPKCFSLGLL